MTSREKKLQLRKYIVNEYKDFLNGKLFLEFGVMKGESILDFYDCYTELNLEKHFFGFDSFVGLPEEKLDNNSPWKTGKFSCGGNINPDLLNKENLEIIDGWYEDTLGDWLLPKFNNRKIGLLHIDCDIYTSTIQVLEFIIKHDLLCDGTLVMYDDWSAYLIKNLDKSQELNVGEARAHTEISKKYNLNFELIHTEIIDPTFHIIPTFRYYA